MTHRLRRGRKVKDCRLRPDGPVGDMGSLGNSVLLQKVQEPTARPSSLKVEHALSGQQLRKRHKKGWKIRLAGDLPERAAHVETNAAHLVPRNSTEDSGEQTHGVIESNHHRLAAPAAVRTMFKVTAPQVRRFCTAPSAMQANRPEKGGRTLNRRPSKGHRHAIR